MTKLTDLTIHEALDGLKSKKFSAVELTQAHIDAMEKHRSLNCYITETPDIALKQAEESDKRYASGSALKMDGIPLGMKDLFCTKDVKTTAGSKMLSDFVPTYESTVSQNLWDQGAVMMGKLNLDQFGMGTANVNSHYGHVVNPWRAKDNPSKEYVAGGSSGGSSASVAAGMCMAATATDTGGSSRQPAAYTGTVGFKPTYGRCSRWGIVAFASSLDQASLVSKDVKDAALMMEVMSGHDPKDSTSAPIDVPDFTAMLKQDVKGLKVGIPKEYTVDGMPSEITDVWNEGKAMLKAAGAEIVDISLPHTHYALPTYYILAPAEASSNLARYDGVRYGLRVDNGGNLDAMYEATRSEGFGDEVKRRIMIGTYTLSAGYYDAYYVKAQKVRRLILNDFIEAYKQCDVILAPTAPGPAFAKGENEDDPIKMYLCDVFTVPASLAGLPALSVPIRLNENGLPLGLQLIGRRFDEQTLLHAAFGLEQQAQFKDKPFGE